MCNSEFRSFAPFGIQKRPNAKCPNCGSLERHRLLFHYLREKTSFFETGTVRKLLHFAPETMFQAIFRQMESIHYFPCDLHPEKYGEEVLRADITNIPFHDTSMDVIFCNHVLEHIPDDQKAIAELYRVTKPGGWRTQESFSAEKIM
jgi:SAM-dependent methyltransferase